ncbi:hypothetical protein ACFL3G_03990 [Planctomycetota bacterium]
MKLKKRKSISGVFIGFAIIIAIANSASAALVPVTGEVFFDSLIGGSMIVVNVQRLEGS